MTRRSRTLLPFLLMAGICVHATLGLAVELPQPVSLGPALNPDTDDTPEFSPDGNTVLFDRSDATHKYVMVAHRVDGKWSAAELAPFSGQWYDQNPVFAPDGSYLLFDSNRPVKAGGEPLVQHYFAQPGPGSNIWRVDRKGAGWGEPVWLGPLVNDTPFIDFPAIAGDGSLYFLRWDAGAVHIFRSQYRAGSYQPAVRVALGDPTVTTHDAAVSPDESFMVLDYGKVKNGLGRLSIAFRQGDHWGAPMDLGDLVNQDIPWGARLSPDGRTVYFTGATKIWSLSLASWLDAKK